MRVIAYLVLGFAIASATALIVDAVRRRHGREFLDRDSVAVLVGIALLCTLTGVIVLRL